MLNMKKVDVSENDFESFLGYIRLRSAKVQKCCFENGVCRYIAFNVCPVLSTNTKTDFNKFVKKVCFDRISKKMIGRFRLNFIKI